MNNRMQELVRDHQPGYMGMEYARSNIGYTKKLHNHYINHTNIDSLNKSTDKIIYHFNVQMHKLYWDRNDLDNGFKDNGFYNVLYWNMKSLNCSNLIAAQGQILRSVGIPVIKIFTPKWEDSNLGHGWCAFLDNNHNYVR